MENKKGTKGTVGTVVCIIIIVILILAGAGAYYLLTQKNNEKIAELEKENKEAIEKLEKENAALEEELKELKKQKALEELIGDYYYKENEDASGESVGYYTDVEISLLKNETFEFYYGEGMTLKGNYEVKDEKIVCKATNIVGEKLDQLLDIEYVFSHDEDTLTLVSKTGKVVFNMIDLVTGDTTNEKKELEEVFEKTESKFIKK